MAAVHLILQGDDYFKDVSLYADSHLGKEVLEIALSSNDRVTFQFENVSQIDELINHLIDAQIARKRQMGKFILKDL